MASNVTSGISPGCTTNIYSVYSTPHVGVNGDRMKIERSLESIFPASFHKLLWSVIFASFGNVQSKSCRLAEAIDLNYYQVDR